MAHNIKNWHQKAQEKRTLGERIADNVADGMGSWVFIIIQTIIVMIWMTLNTIAFIHHWDVYPFVLLNLLFSTQAAYAAPIIMMSQNRQAARDKAQAEHEYEHQELEIQELHKINKKQLEILNEQTAMLEALHTVVGVKFERRR